MDSSNNIYQKREVCLMDIHSRIEKHHIDEVLSQKYQITSSKIQKRLNIEFKTAAIARDVKQFLDDKELKYNGKDIKFTLKGNRFLVDGMLDVPFEEVRNFFSSWGEVNNIYITKKYFATLASISQAVELVEKIGALTIDGTRVEIKYAFDRNIGFANSSNKNFEIKNKDSSSKFGSTHFLDSTNPKPIIQFVQSNTQISKPLVVLGSLTTGGDNLSDISINSNSINGNHGGTSANNNNNAGHRQNLTARSKKKPNEHSKQVFNHQQKHKQQKFHGPLAIDGQPVGKHKDKKNHQTTMVSNQTLIKMLPNPQVNLKQTTNVKQQNQKQALLNTPVQPKPENVKLNSLKSNHNLPLFAKTPQTSVTSESKALASFGSSSLLNKLDYNSLEFKSTDYLENKTKQNKTKEPVHTITTYYNRGNANNNPIQPSKTAGDSMITGQQSKSIPQKIVGLLYDDPLKSIAQQISNYKIDNCKIPVKSNENHMIPISSSNGNNVNLTHQKNLNNTINKTNNHTGQTTTSVRPSSNTFVPQQPKKFEMTNSNHQSFTPKEHKTQTSPKTKKEENCVIS